MADETTPEVVQTPEKLDQKVTIDDAGPARKKITIEIPEARIAESVESSFKDLQGEATLPGFRRGRAPMRLLEKRFGTDVRNEVKSRVVGESFQQVVEENDLKMLGEPEIKDIEKLELPESGSLTVEVEIEVSPEFELPDLKALEVTKTSAEVTKDQVDAEIQRFCEMQGQIETIDGKAKVGDYLVGDVEVKLEDGEIAESRRGTNIRVSDPDGPTKGKGQIAGVLIEDLTSRVVGNKAGESVEITATGPARHENEKLREAKLAIELKITSVQRMVSIEMDKLIEMSGFENEEELRDQVKFNLERRATSEAEQKMRQQVTDAILEKIDFDLPEGLSSRQTERVLQRQAMQMMYQGASEQDIEQAQAELRAASEKEAQRELKLFFILNKAAEKFDIDVSEAEINGRVAEMAVQSNRRPEKVRQEMAKSGRLEQLFIQLREEKVIDKLLEDAKVTEVAAEADKADKADKPAAAKKTTEKKTEKKTTKKKTTKKKTTKKSSSKKSDE